VELKEWIRGIEIFFARIKVPEEKRVNIETFYLTGEEVDVWWSTIKDRLIGP